MIHIPPDDGSIPSVKRDVIPGNDKEAMLTELGRFRPFLRPIEREIQKASATPRIGVTEWK
jgi:hypothetical protein